MRLILGGALLLLLSGCGNDGWYNESDPLGPTENTISRVNSGEYVLVFWCSSKQEYDFRFSTSELQTVKDRPTKAILRSEKLVYNLKIRTDNNPVRDQAATSLWTSDDLLLYSARDANIIDAVRAIAAAKTRVVVGAEPNVSGGRNHVVTFSAKGAREAIEKSFKACGIDPKPST
jgi:hypothetical protein